LLEPLGAQVGAYFAQYHNRSPLIGVVKAGRPDPFIVGDPDGLNPKYFVEYAERIQMYRVNVVARPPSTTMYAEVMHRPNQPVQFHGTAVTNASTSNTANSLIRPEYAAVPLGGIFRAYDRLSVSDILLGGNKAFGGILGAKTLVLG